MLLPPPPPTPSSFILLNPKLIVRPRNRRDDDGNDGIPFAQRLGNTNDSDNDDIIMWKLVDQPKEKEQEEQEQRQTVPSNDEEDDDEETLTSSSSSSSSLSDVGDNLKTDDSAFLVAEKECLKEQEDDDDDVDVDVDVDEMVQTMCNISVAELSPEAKNLSQEDDQDVNEDDDEDIQVDLPNEEHILQVGPTDCEEDEKIDAIDPPGRRLSTVKVLPKSRSKESLTEETNNGTQEDLIDTLILKITPLPGQDSCSTTTATFSSSKSGGDSSPSSSNSTILIDAVDGDDNCSIIQNSFKEETSSLPDDSKMHKVVVLRRSNGKTFEVLENVQVTVLEEDRRRDSDDVKDDDTKAATMAATDNLLLEKHLLCKNEEDSGTKCTEEDDEDSIFDSLEEESCSSTSQDTLLPFDIVPTSAGYEIKMFSDATDEQCSYTLQCLDVISTSSGYEINLGTTGVEAAFLQHTTKSKLMRRAQKNKDFEIIQMEERKGGTNDVVERFESEALVDTVLENMLLGRLKKVGDEQASSQQPCQFVIVMESSLANKAFVQQEENDASTLVDDEEEYDDDDQSDLTSRSGSTEYSEEFTNDSGTDDGSNITFVSSTMTGDECDKDKMSSPCPVLSIKAEVKELEAMEVQDVLDTMKVEEAYPEQPDLKSEFKVIDMKSSLSVVPEGEVESCVTEENYPSESEVEMVGDEKHVDVVVAEADVIVDEGLDNHELAPGPEVEVVGIAVHSNGMVEI